MPMLIKRGKACGTERFFCRTWLRYSQVADGVMDFYHPELLEGVNTTGTDVYVLRVDYSRSLVRGYDVTYKELFTREFEVALLGASA